MKKPTVFKALLLIARPAAGKSEIIDYLTRLPAEERKRDFHVGQFTVIDDFPMLWTWFEEDDILTRLGHPRLHTESDGCFKDVYMWDLLIERICLDYRKFRRDHSSENTAIIEFSRGSQHGGYQRAFEHLSKAVLKDMAILYVDVPWEESMRKNKGRFNPDKPDSILEHGLSDAKLEYLYKETDWESIVHNQPLRLLIKGIQVPYVIFDNHDDVTTGRDQALGERLRCALQDLWQLYS
ncbi:MAG: hypothetical protein JW704_08330 [Anaerolineaceae bacterium]|nr:hypothetical protein [Anaerolineaceae bacterium]MBN2677647.1 hypothetical protein [Anaerolineaceae bacterium]